MDGCICSLISFFLDEAEKADRIAIIDHGRLVTIDTPERLKKTIGQDIVSVKTDDDWDAIFGPNEVGVAVNLKIEDSVGVARQMRLVKEELTINTVLHHEVLNSGGSKFGYLVFQQFLENSREELTTVFAEFKQVQHLVVVESPDHHHVQLRPLQARVPQRLNTRQHVRVARATGYALIAIGS